MKPSEIRELTENELVERIQNESETLIRLKMNHAVSPLDNPGQIKNVRRNIARLKTILQQREMSKK